MPVALTRFLCRPMQRQSASFSPSKRRLLSFHSYQEFIRRCTMTCGDSISNTATNLHPPGENYIYILTLTTIQFHKDTSICQWLCADVNNKNALHTLISRTDVGGLFRFSRPNSGFLLPNSASVARTIVFFMHQTTIARSVQNQLSSGDALS